MKIGIFGGTFDPFTKAHLAIVEKVLEQNLVDKVIILPTIVSWHRAGKNNWLTDIEKIYCINMFIANSDYKDRITVDMHEITYVKTAFSKYIYDRRYVHMLSDAIFRYGINNEYYTIIGTDSLVQFNTWWKYDVILGLSQLIAVSGRDNVELPKDTYNAQIVSIDKKYFDVSASKIRSKFDNLDSYLETI